MKGERLARSGHRIFESGKEVEKVTSGTGIEIVVRSKLVSAT